MRGVRVPLGLIEHLAESVLPCARGSVAVVTSPRPIDSPPLA